MQKTDDSRVDDTASRDTETDSVSAARKLWQKLRRSAKRAGRQVVEHALVLHYAAQNPSTPSWARRAAYGAIAYFILPTDAVPDWLAAVGYTDDLGVLAAAIATLTQYIDEDARAKARERTQALLGKHDSQQRATARSREGE